MEKVDKRKYNPRLNKTVITIVINTITFDLFFDG